MLSLLLRTRDSNLSASLICYLLEVAGANLLDFQNIFYSLSPEIFIQIIDPQEWLIKKLVSSLEEQGNFKIYQQVDTNVYLELGRPHGEIVKNSSKTLLVDEAPTEIDLFLKPLHQLFQEGSSARHLSWAQKERSGDFLSSLLSQVYLKLDLRLELTKKATTPELWILPKKNLAALLRILSKTSEKDLSNIQLAQAALPNGDEAIIIREELAPGRKISRFFPSAQQTYTSLLSKGLPLLFIPTNTRLKPDLRGDYLRALMGYQPQELVILDLINEEIVAFSLPVQAFVPALSIINYKISAVGKRMLKLHDPFKFRKNPTFLQSLLTKLHPSKIYKAIPLETVRPTPISVPLRLDTKSEIAPPDLWLVPIEKTPNMINIMMKSSLQNFLIACVGDEKGAPEFFLVKEAISRSKLLPKDGLIFTQHPDVPNLFIPCDKFLSPSLSPQRYLRDLGISPDEINIVMETEMGIDLYQIPESAAVEIQHLEDIERILYDFEISSSLSWAKKRKKKQQLKPEETQKKTKTEGTILIPKEAAAKKVPQRRKSEQVVITWKEAASYLQESGISVPSNLLTEFSGISPEEFIKEWARHQSMLTTWKKKGKGL